ncbi:hypothetical protein RYA05_13595 [Pseudomonas syringae pv. actinidiae]|nr:hypothetical protein [Pseudomonas syringae pv. actinidiae]
MTRPTNCKSPSLSDLGCPGDAASSVPLEKIDLSLYLPFGQWEKFELSSREDHLSSCEAIASLISGHLFGKAIAEKMAESED